MPCPGSCTWAFGTSRWRPSPTLPELWAASLGHKGQSQPQPSLVRVDPGSLLHVPSGALGLRPLRKESKRSLLSPVPGSKVQNAVNGLCTCRASGSTLVGSHNHHRCLQREVHSGRGERLRFREVKRLSQGPMARDGKTRARTGQRRPRPTRLPLGVLSHPGRLSPAQFPMSHRMVGVQRPGSGTSRLPRPFSVVSRSSCLVWMACKPTSQLHGGSCGFRGN